MIFPASSGSNGKMEVEGRSSGIIFSRPSPALRSSLPALSREILELAKTRGEITVKEVEESTGANRNTIKVHLRKLASDNYLAQVGKGRGARYTLK